jgi:hypothetical protein
MDRLIERAGLGEHRPRCAFAGMHNAMEHPPNAMESRCDRAAIRAGTALVEFRSRSAHLPAAGDHREPKNRVIQEVAVLTGFI